jgi:hypothetical protein
MYYLVRFHGDGGQACIPGVRCFSDLDVADGLAEILRGEPGHYCRNSVLVEESAVEVLAEEWFDLNPVWFCRSLNKQYYARLLNYCRQHDILWGPGQRA